MMISIIRYFFGLNKSAKISRPKGCTKANQLQYQAPFNHQPKDQVLHHMFGEALTDFKVTLQSCLTLVQEKDETIGDSDGNDDVANACAAQDLKESQYYQNSSTQSLTTILLPQKYSPRLQNNINLNTNRINRISSNYSISIYSSDEIYLTENMENLPRRAKTPVFFIGQLEREAMENDPSEYLANEYQTVLPQPSIASCLDIDVPPLNPAKRTLRKVKSQESLRDLCKSYAASPSIASDSETLVGSDGGSSPRGSIFKENGKDENFEFKDMAPSAYEPLEKTSVPDDQDISLQICSELLTSKLTTALHQGHSIERENKFSSLEILLMIECYESIRKELRSNPHNNHVTSTAEEALDHWIKALYTIYEDCHGIKYNKKCGWSSQKPQKPVSALAEQQNECAMLNGFSHGNDRPIDFQT